tara:strand:- start:178 stop:399 length:222 start_codon:yes stop_codon:yes gene_type:complete
MNDTVEVTIKWNNANESAFKDITKWIEEQDLLVMDGKDVWIVTPSSINNKQQRKLNRELGLHTLHKSREYREK